jgi:hypothetical protein
MWENGNGIAKAVPILFRVSSSSDFFSFTYKGAAWLDRIDSGKTYLVAYVLPGPKLVSCQVSWAQNQGVRIRKIDLKSNTNDTHPEALEAMRGP